VFERKRILTKELDLRGFAGETTFQETGYQCVEHKGEYFEEAEASVL